ncbi:MAG: hypothetical protein QXH34_08150 [Ignisphaera sp.]
MSGNTFYEDYDFYRPIAKSIKEHIMLEGFKSPINFIIDAAILHYKDWTSIIFNPKSKSPWKRILQRYYNTDEYKRLNEKVNGDPLLAKYATIRFLRSLTYLSDIHFYTRDLNKFSQESSEVNEKEKRIASGLAYEAMEILEEVETLKGLVEISSWSRGLFGKGYANEGVPILRLDDPEAIRLTVSKKIIVNFVKLCRQYRKLAESGSVARVPTLYGGIPVGIKTITRIGEIPKSIPQELVDEEIFEMKIATKTLRVFENYGSLNDAVVYIDKSGSMAESFGSGVPKISFACASALALAKYLKDSGAKMTLKFFDLEVYEGITDLKKIIEVLSRVSADGGTRINSVLEDAMNYPDKRVIIISDGIDEVSEDLCRKLSNRAEVKVIFIETDNKLMRKYFDCHTITEPKPIILKI